MPRSGLKEWVTAENEVIKVMMWFYYILVNESQRIWPISTRGRGDGIETNVGQQKWQNRKLKQDAEELLLPVPQKWKI